MNTKRGFAIITVSFLWLAICLGSRNVPSRDFVYVMVYVWGATIFLLPLALAFAGGQLLAPSSHVGSHSRLVRWLLSAAVVACFVAGYIMCLGVLERISTVWWEYVKFGGDSITLGRGAAEYFALIAVVVGAVAYALHRLAAVGDRIAFLNRAALSLVASASLLYFMLGVSPYAEWRA